MHDSGVLDDINVFGRPSCCDVRYDSLLKERPIAREANEKWSGLVDVRSGRRVPWWDRREVSWRFRRCCEREGVYDGSGRGSGNRFVQRSWFEGRDGFFGYSEGSRNIMVKIGLCDDESCDEDEGKDKDAEAASEHAQREHNCGSEQLPEAKCEMDDR